MKPSLFAILIGGIVLVGIGFLFSRAPKHTNLSMDQLTLKSSAFKNNERIPVKFTCDGENVSPFFEVKFIPEGTKSFALVVDDPDATRAGVWDHWIVWNIDPKTQYISEDAIPFGAKLGTTSFGSQRYGGPCPPKGSEPHHYRFKLYALDIMLNLPDGASKKELEAAMTGHILQEALLTGLYSRN